MEIQINYLAVLVCAILSMVIGMVWYGPYLFGPAWLEVMGVDPKDSRKIKASQKKYAPLYGVQFLLSLLQLYILAHFIAGWQEASGIESSLWIYLGFVLPTVAGAAMWSGKPKKLALSQFLMTAGYQLVCFIVFGYVLGAWR